jgi:polyhydroxybutyrate depolymerase
MADQIAAIAPISSNMRERMIADCHPSRPVPVFEWHGLLDHYSPYGGGMTAATDTAPVPPVQETIRFWENIDGTQGVTHMTMFGGAVDCDVYSAGWNNAVVQQCRVPNMGHRWPGARPTTRSQRGDFLMRRVRGELGPYSPPMDANDAILEFFSRYKLP